MSPSADNPEINQPSERLEMDFRSASFPSDALSIARLRRVFPEKFDASGSMSDGYPSNFFFPMSAEQPGHLVRLTELLSDERYVASGAYYRALVDKHPELYPPEDIEFVAESKRRLEENYQFFKLADSPETARLLIRQVEEEGEKEAQQAKSKGR